MWASIDRSRRLLSCLFRSIIHLFCLFRNDGIRTTDPISGKNISIPKLLPLPFFSRQMETLIRILLCTFPLFEMRPLFIIRSSQINHNASYAYLQRDIGKANVENILSYLRVPEKLRVFLLPHTSNKIGLIKELLLWPLPRFITMTLESFSLAWPYFSLALSILTSFSLSNGLLRANLIHSSTLTSLPLIFSKDHRVFFGLDSPP